MLIDFLFLIFQTQRKYLLDIFVDQSCPTRILNAFVDSWLSSAPDNFVIFEWISEKIEKMIVKIEHICKLYYIYQVFLRYLIYVVGSSIDSMQYPAMMLQEQFGVMHRLMNEIIVLIRQHSCKLLVSIKSSSI